MVSSTAHNVAFTVQRLFSARFVTDFHISACKYSLWLRGVRVSVAHRLRQKEGFWVRDGKHTTGSIARNVLSTVHLLFSAVFSIGFRSLFIFWSSPWAPSPTASRVTRATRVICVCGCGCLPCCKDPPGRGARAYPAGCCCRFTSVVWCQCAFAWESKDKKGEERAEERFHNQCFSRWDTWCGVVRWLIDRTVGRACWACLCT